MTQLQAQSAIVLRGAQTLHSAEPGARGELAKQMQELVREARDTDRGLAEQLRRTLVTPLDAEDIRHLSACFRRVLEQQARMAQAFPWAEELGAELTLRGVQCAEELTAAARSLPSNRLLVAHTANVHAHGRAAKLLLRERRAGVFACEPISRVLCFDQFSKFLGSLFREYALAARALERVLFKNS